MLNSYGKVFPTQPPSGRPVREEPSPQGRWEPHTDDEPDLENQVERKKSIGKHKQYSYTHALLAGGYIMRWLYVGFRIRVRVSLLAVALPAWLGIDWQLCAHGHCLSTAHTWLEALRLIPHTDCVMAHWLNNYVTM